MEASGLVVVPFPAVVDFVVACVVAVTFSGDVVSS